MIDCVIFAGAQLDMTVDEINIPEGVFVICADRGLEHAKMLGIVPDLIVGDFDSLGYRPDEDCEILAFKPEKDDTDLMIAVKQAIARGRKNIAIYSALGGRLDHTIGNIQSIAYALEHGASAELISADERVCLLSPGKYSFDKNDDLSLSLFSYGGEVTGLTLSGTKYTLENGTLSDSFPLGISNVITSDNAVISFESGRLLVIRSDLK